MYLATTDLLRIPKLYDLKDLSFKIKLSTNLLYKLSRFPERYYAQASIPKKNGGVRNLACPSKKLKVVQAWILRNILDKVEISTVATAFRKDLCVRNNVDIHSGNRYFLCLDIKDFFDSIKFIDILRIFLSLGYNLPTSYTLTNLCTYKGALPQGGVTSPALSNIACIRLDERILGFTGARNIIYSRYADDMTFSAKEPERLIKAIKIIEKFVIDEGFEINQNKTRMLGPRQRRSITGLIISESNIGIGKQKKRILRAAIHKYETQSLSLNDREKLYQWIKGWLSYLNSVDKVGYEQLNQYWQSLTTKKQVAATITD